MTVFLGLRALNILTDPGCSPNQTSPEGEDGCDAGVMSFGLKCRKERPDGISF